MLISCDSKKPIACHSAEDISHPRRLLHVSFTQSVGIIEAYAGIFDPIADEDLLHGFRFHEHEPLDSKWSNRPNDWTILLGPLALYDACFTTNDVPKLPQDRIPQGWSWNVT